MFIPTKYHSRIIQFVCVVFLNVNILLSCSFTRVHVFLPSVSLLRFNLPVTLRHSLKCEIIHLESKYSNPYSSNWALVWQESFWLLSKQRVLVFYFSKLRFSLKIVGFSWHGATLVSRCRIGNNYHISLRIPHIYV